MKIIKFRAWDKENNKMVDVIDFSSMNYPNKYEIMQFTGLKDINDKKIFEGDIVEWRYPDNWCWEKRDRKKHPNAGQLGWTLVMEWNERRACFNLPDPWYVPVVIGNIYESEKKII